MPRTVSGASSARRLRSTDGLGPGHGPAASVFALASSAFVWWTHAANPPRQTAGRNTEGGRIMKAALLFSLLLGVIPVLAAEPKGTPPEAKVTTLMTKPLPDFPGKELLMITVEYPPGGADPVHKHNAHALVYVLEGSIVMGVEGGKPVTLTPGQTFYEGPTDIHTIGRNASQTEPAKFVVVLLKDANAPVFIPVK